MSPRFKGVAILGFIHFRACNEVRPCWCHLMPLHIFADRNERFFLSLSLNALSDMRVLGTHGNSEPTAF